MNKKNKKLLLKFLDKQTKNETALDRYKTKKRKDIVIFLIIIIIFMSIIWFINSSHVKLKNINISGISQLDKNDVLNKIKINNDVKIWDVNENDIITIIKKEYKIVSDVSVDVKYLQTLNITIKERKLLAREYKKEENKYYNILDNGEYYDGKLNNEYNTPILDNFKNDDKKNKVLKNLSELKFEVLTYISEIYSDEKLGDIMTIYMTDGQKIKANGINFSNKLNYYFDIEQHIKNKNKTTLNIVNGVYLEDDSNSNKKNEKIQAIVASNEKDNKEDEKNNNKITKNKKENKEKIIDKKQRKENNNSNGG